MAERKILTLANRPLSHEDAERHAAGALSEIGRLKARLAAAAAEISDLQRQNARREGPLLAADEFLRQMGHRAGSGAGGVLVRVTIANLADVSSRFGEEQAEALCVHVARWLRGHIRGDDLVGRMGLSIFAVYLSRADDTGAIAKFNRLRRRIEDDPLSLSGHDVTAVLDIETSPLAAARAVARS